MINYINFIKESNRIEGLHHEPTEAEIKEFNRFINLDSVTIKDLQNFVEVYAPGHVLRTIKGMDVRVGGYLAPAGGKEIKPKLEKILEHLAIYSPYATHVKYELLHPFSDGNGRSGRALWAWQMCRADTWSKINWHRLGFLHTYYYQSLTEAAIK